MTSSQVLASLVPGSLIASRYSVEHALGKGGMGTVYAVRDLSTGRRLALKCLQRQAAAENGPTAALFQREYHTLAHLRHPQVIHVFDYGLDGTRPYYTMELLDGSDLRELAPLPWRRACQVLRDVASSLALLHSRRLLHRDLSPRNVRCTRDGQAKLLDFGTMASMGVANDMAGTPPYMAPEAVHGQALDARTDLFALGALAYWTLTGYDAYAARDVRELRQLWLRPILPPSAIAGGVPEPLDGLVMSLLNLDPQARPGHAAEVIERLTAIAGLAPVEQLEVARAYLTSPTLVGRSEELASFHKRIVRAVRGRGSALLIRGRAGLGRSRLLQSLVLEAKLNGVQVLTADSEAAPRGHLGVVHALVDALCENLPDIALPTFAPHAAVLGAMFPALHAQLAAPPPLAPPGDRREHLAGVLHAIRSWIVAVSRLRPLMIAVDDADHADDASTVCLALLADDARDEHLVVAAVSDHETRNKALDVLCAEAPSVELTPLDAEQTAMLLRSVFGDVPNLHVVAGWIAPLASGNPRTVMELAQYLVDHGIARYQRGSWTLPETLRDQALPASMEQALDERVAQLSPPARALAEALALVTDHGHLELIELVRLGGELQSPELAYRAVDELVATQVTDVVGSRHRLRQRGLARSLVKDIPEQRRRLLHMRLAVLYESRPGSDGPNADAALISIYHRFLGGDLHGCLERLPEVKSASQSAFAHTPEAVSMYEACLTYGQAIHLPPARLHPMRRVLLRLSSVSDPALVRHELPMLEQLCRDSGRVYLSDMADEPDQLSRIRQCIRRARDAYQQMPLSERGLAPSEAIYELGASALTLIRTYLLRRDHDALRRLDALVAPFRPLSPAFELLCELAQQSHDSLLRLDVSARWLQTLATLEQPIDGMEPASQQAIRCLLVYWLGLEHAATGRASALEHAAFLEGQSLYAALGAQVRSIYHLFAGNEAEAEACQRRRELLVLESPFKEMTGASGSVYEALGYYVCGSVLGMRRALSEAQKLADRHPGWRPVLRDLEGLHALLCGEPSTALLMFESAGGTSGHVQALLALGRADQARALAEDALQRAPQPHQPIHLLRLQAARALAYCACGAREAAATLLDADIEDAERAGIGGMLLCIMHEARARIAIEMEDAGAFRRHVRKLGATYGRGTSGLRARYEQLGAAARLALMSVPPPRAPADLDSSSEIRSLFGAAHSSEQRLACALSLIAQRARASRGFLFGMHGANLHLSASLGDARPPDGLEDMLAVYLSAELETCEAVPAQTTTGTFSAEPDMVAWINDGQQLYYPVLLSCVSGGRRLVCGVVVLALPLQRVPRVSPELVSEISHALLDAGDVTGADAAN